MEGRKLGYLDDASLQTSNMAGGVGYRAKYQKPVLAFARREIRNTATYEILSRGKIPFATKMVFSPLFLMFGPRKYPLEN